MEIIKIIVSFLCGILASMGVGGGSVLIIILTQFMDVSHEIARFTNLVSFIPTASIASIINKKNGLIIKKAALICMISGVFAAVFGTYIGSVFSTDMIKKVFGGALIAMGCYEFFRKA